MGTNIDQYLTPEEHNQLDHGDVPGIGGTISPVNEAAHGFVVGQPIYYSGSGWELAQADVDTTTADAVVFSVEDVDNFRYIQAGEIDLTTGEWDAVTGGSGGLTPGEHYRLDEASAGMLTDAAVGSGINQFILRALSATKAMVYMGEPHSGAATPAVNVQDAGSPLGLFNTLNFSNFASVLDAGSGIASIIAPQLQVDTDLLVFNGAGAQITSSFSFTPKIALFFSGLRNDQEGSNHDETLSVGFATGTGTGTSPLQQASVAQIGGYHSSGTADRDRTSVDNGWVAAALAFENTTATSPLTNHLDLGAGGSRGAVALRVTQFNSSGIQLTPTFNGNATTLHGRAFVIVLG